MEFTIDRDVAQSAISFASMAVASKSPQPIMEMLRIEAKGSQVGFSGTNSALYIEVWVEAEEVKSEGAFCANSLLASLLPDFKPGELVFKTEKMLTLTQGKTKNRFAIASAEEFPKKPALENFVSIDRQKFVRALEVCSIALSNPNRADMPATQGFNINPHLDAISTSDGDQVVYYPIELEGNIAIPAGSYLTSMLPRLRSAEDLRVSIGSSNWVGFEASGWEIYVNQKQGNFPDLSAIIKRAEEVEPALKVMVDVAEVKRILSKAAKLSDVALSSGRLHHLAINRDGNELSFQMTAHDIGSMHEVLEYAEMEGRERYRILVHPKILKEVFDVTNSDKLTLQFYQPSNPFLVKDPTDDYTYVQVAMKLDNEAEILAKGEEDKAVKKGEKEKAPELESELIPETSLGDDDVRELEEVSDF